MAENPIISDFIRIVENEVREFENVSQQLQDTTMTSLALLVKDAFEEEFEFIKRGLRCPEPKQIEDMIGTLLDIIHNKIASIRTSLRPHDEFFNHVATIHESIGGLLWISVPKTPVQFIQEMKDAGDYFGNRVLSAKKGDVLHSTWINKWTAVLKALEAYVKKYHTTGFAWNQIRQDVRVLPPNPPPPPPPVIDDYSSGDAWHEPTNAPVDPRGNSMDATFRIINQRGDNITGLLRPVRAARRPAAPSDAQRPAAPIDAQPPAAPIDAQAQNLPRPAQQAPDPVFLLEGGRRWRIEYQIGRLQGPQQVLELRPNSSSETVAMYKCQRVTLNVQTKINNIIIENCKRCVVILRHVIASVELIRCESLELRCMGSTGGITVDSCDCIQIFISDLALECEITTSKSSSVNACRLYDNGDYKETPIPDQIKTTFNRKKADFESQVVMHG